MKDVTQELKRIRREHGFTAEFTPRGQHWRVYDGESWIATVGGTPSPGALLRFRGDIRRYLRSKAGV